MDIFIGKINKKIFFNKYLDLKFIIEYLNKVLFIPSTLISCTES